MGKRGPLPKPASLKKLAGNPGKRALPKNEPQPVGDLIEPPLWFSRRQKAIWRNALRHAPPGVLKTIDGSVLELWTVAVDLHATASTAIARQGAVVTINGARRKSPWIAVLKDQATTIAKAANLLGFAPAARPRLAENARLPGYDAAQADPEIDADLEEKRALAEFRASRPARH